MTGSNRLRYNWFVVIAESASSTAHWDRGPSLGKRHAARESDPTPTSFSASDSRARSFLLTPDAVYRAAAAVAGVDHNHPNGYGFVGGCPACDHTLATIDPCARPTITIDQVRAAPALPGATPTTENPVGR